MGKTDYLVKRKMIKFALLLLLVLIASDTKEIYTITTPKIVLITIDGVRWQDIFDAHDGIGSFKPESKNLVPNIYKNFVDGGMAIGKNSQALVGGPAHVSLPGYLEIMRGYPSLDCTDNYCGQNTKPTLIDEFAGDAAVFSGWEPISRVFDNSLAV